MKSLLGIVFSLLLCGVGHAEMMSVDVHSAALRSSPSSTASYVLLELPRYYPLAVLESTDEFYRVADFRDRTGWISKSELEKVPGVVVAGRIVNLRKESGTDSEIVFKAEKGVTFKVLEEKGDWLKVFHESGKIGWIYKKLVWGM